MLVVGLVKRIYRIGSGEEQVAKAIMGVVVSLLVGVAQEGLRACADSDPFDIGNALGYAAAAWVGAMALHKLKKDAQIPERLEQVKEDAKHDVLATLLNAASPKKRRKRRG